ncbi:MAG: STAS domain-containing protein, partial [Gammaproteobacteria bacterium]|nr:STAS domain-containing protein [Gammaproteobacteria bacterium]
MSEVAETSARPIARVRIGVATHLAPTSALNSNDALQDLLLVIDDCIEGGEFKIILDFAAVQVIDSLAISALLDLQNRLIKLGGWVKITGHNSIIAEVAEITGLSDYITFLNSSGERDRKKPDEVSCGPGARLGDILVARKLISQSRIDEALKLQERLGKRMGQIIIDKGWVGENDVLRALGEQLGVPFVRLRPGLFDPATSGLLDRNVARRLCVVPLFRVRSTVYLATAKPQDMPTFEEVSERLQCVVRPVLARKEDIQKLLNESL